MHDATAIKQRVDLVGLLEKNNVEVHGNGRTFSALCPFHEERTPSFRIWPEKQWWYCYGCGRRGDCFTFVMEKDNVTFPQAVEQLGAGELGIPIVRKVRTVPPARSIDLSVVEEFHQNLLHRQDILQFLARERFWSLSVIQKQQIGYYPEKHRITIPIFDPFRQDVYDIRLYRPHGKPKMLPWSEGRSALPYDAGGMFRRDCCIMTEGEADALALASLGYPTVTHTCGTRSATRVWSVWGGTVLAKHLFICYDRDEPGQTATQEIQKIFPHAQSIPIPEETGPTGDITDLIRLWGAEKTKKYVDRAQESIVSLYR